MTACVHTLKQSIIDDSHDPITIERLDCQLTTQIMAIAIGSGCIILDFLRNFLFDHPVVESLRTALS